LADEPPTDAPAKKPAAPPATRAVRMNPELAGITAHEDAGWVITHDPKGTEVPADVAERMLAHLVPWNGRMQAVAVPAEQ
jgi:hypothetical protein